MFTPDTPYHTLVDHLYRIWVRTFVIVSVKVFTGSRNREKSGLRPTDSRFARVLIIAILPRVIRLHSATALLPLSRSGSSPRVLSQKVLTINELPFRALVLRVPLGSTNSQLTNIAEKPAVLRRPGF